MSLDECIQKHTYRQYLAWLEWLQEEQNNPSASDYYLMSIAAEVRRSVVKQPSSVKLDDFRIQFKAGPTPPPDPTIAAAQAKALWRARLNLPPG